MPTVEGGGSPTADELLALLEYPLVPDARWLPAHISYNAGSEGPLILRTGPGPADAREAQGSRLGGTGTAATGSAVCDGPARLDP